MISVWHQNGLIKATILTQASNGDQASVITTAMDSNDFLGVVLEVEEHKNNEKVIFSIV